MTSRSTSPTRAQTSRRGPSSSRPARSRSPARRVERERPALGESALRLARPPRDRISLVDRAVPPRARARRPLPASTTSAATSPTGRFPRGNKTARSGRWRAGPGAELFHAVERALGDLPLIAEDLGRITPAVCRLRDELHLPGMAVLQWAFRRLTLESPRGRAITVTARSSTRARTTRTRRSAGSSR